MSLFDDFKRRVAFVAAEMKRAGGCPDSRAFDDCFEMYDSAMLTAAILRLAREDRGLREAMERDEARTPGVFESWRASEAAHSHLSDEALEAAALEARTAGRAETTAWIEAGCPEWSGWIAARGAGSVG